MNVVKILVCILLVFIFSVIVIALCLTAKFMGPITEMVISNGSVRWNAPPNAPDNVVYHVTWEVLPNVDVGFSSVKDTQFNISPITSVYAPCNIRVSVYGSAPYYQNTYTHSEIFMVSK
jgi:hypothetical protein